jgi:hypothetical protein
MIPVHILSYIFKERKEKNMETGVKNSKWKNEWVTVKKQRYEIIIIIIIIIIIKQKP